MKSALEQLQDMTVVVADTGDAALVKKFAPEDCTTNPSLVLATLETSDGRDLARQERETLGAGSEDAETLCDRLTVAVGARLASLIPGRVSTEVDARFSFDVDASVRRAYDIVAEYDRRGVSSDRILIKLAATWEGIKAAERLERDGIKCNLTLLFSMEQARACADAGVYLISPFVGRITDWYKKAEGVEDYAPEDDPGVASVREIYRYYKSSGIKTIVMGASFRNTGQIKALAGCDRLTISPDLLGTLSRDLRHIDRVLGNIASVDEKPKSLLQAQFRWGMNENVMASEKLADGIRKFNADHRALLRLLAASS